MRKLYTRCMLALICIFAFVTIVGGVVMVGLFIKAWQDTNEMRKLRARQAETQHFDETFWAMVDVNQLEL